MPDNALMEELHVGTVEIFRDAGFHEVLRPTLRRSVMRVEFDGPAGRAEG